jgi:hypothetical protein
MTLIYDDVNGFLERNLQTTYYGTFFMYIDIIIWLSNSIQDTVSGDYIFRILQEYNRIISKIYLAAITDKSLQQTKHLSFVSIWIISKLLVSGISCVKT